MSLVYAFAIYLTSYNTTNGSLPNKSRLKKNKEKINNESNIEKLCSSMTLDFQPIESSEWNEEKHFPSVPSSDQRYVYWQYAFERNNL